MPSWCLSSDSDLLLNSVARFPPLRRVDRLLETDVGLPIVHRGPLKVMKPV